MLSKIKKITVGREKQLKLAICITMYNEDEDELKTTLTGVLQNYNELKRDENLGFKK